MEKLTAFVSSFEGEKATTVAGARVGTNSTRQLHEGASVGSSPASQAFNIASILSRETNSRYVGEVRRDHTTSQLNVQTSKFSTQLESAHFRV